MSAATALFEMSAKHASAPRKWIPGSMSKVLLTIRRMRLPRYRRDRPLLGVAALLAAASPEVFAVALKRRSGRWRWFQIALS